MKLVYALILLISLQGFGQDYARQASWSSITMNPETAPKKEVEVVIKKAEGRVPGDINSVPSVVINSFKQEYPGAINISWFLAEKQSTVYFNWENEMVIKKYNNNDGSVSLTRKTYTIEKLDRPFTDFLKREFGDHYDVNYITEFIMEDGNYFEINMTTPKEWLVVKLTRENTTGVLAITEKKLYKR